ncbi:MAG: SusC/RagA family TonB-linked outer membrane protein [Prevotella sp.]
MKRLLLKSLMLMGMLLVIIPESQAQRNNSEISLKVENQPLTVALRQLEKTTDYKFMYANEDLASHRVTCSVRSRSIDQVMTALLRGLPFDYKVKEKFVYVTLKQRTQQAKPAEKQENKKVTISGTVTDSNGEPLPGVTVMIKGRLGGIVTSDAGKFDFFNDAGKPIEVTYSFIGMKPLVKTYDCKRDYTGLKIVLEESESALKDVVVTGIFSRRAESFTGSATTMTHDELISVGNKNLIQSLKNLDPSLVIADNYAAGSNPNSLPDMELRGTSSFPDIRGTYTSNPNLPLFILDGFETTLDKVVDLDINRIESVTLLKDAAAKAIYGSKAANGVMVIETRRVKTGELRVNYIGSLNLEMPDLSSYNLCNAREKLELERALGVYDNANPQLDYQKKQLYYNNLAEVERGVDTDWLAIPLRNGVGHKHSVNLEVGNSELRVGASLSYNNVVGVMKGSSRNTVSGSLSIIYHYKKLLVRNQFSFTNTNSEESPYGTFSAYAKLNPYWRPYNEDGTLRKYLGQGPMLSESVYNPMFNATINTTDKKDYTDYTNNTYLEYQFNEGMKLTGRLNVQSRVNGSEKFLPGSHLSFINTAEDDFLKRGSYTQGYGKYFAVNGDVNFNYSKNWNKHIFFANLGANIREVDSEYYYHTAVGFPNDKMDNIIFAKQYAENSTPTGSESIDREVGGLFALNYSYDDRYLADFSLRASASSQFGADNRWGTFWSGGLGWNMHNESWFKDSKIVKQLRLRGSLGYTGSQNFNSYQGMLLYNYFTNDSYLGMIGTYLEGLANTALKWQQKYDVNIGTDINLFGRLNIRFDYYRAITDNLLTDITTPPSLGFSTYKANLGKMENTGYEFRVNGLVFSRPESRTSLNVFVSGTHNKNKIKEISNSLQSLTSEQDKAASTSNVPYVRFVEGQSMTAIWAVRSKGIDPSSGKEVFVRPDGTLTDTWSAMDQVVCGDTNPTIRGNVGFSFEHKGLQFSFTGLYRIGGYIYNSTLVQKVENANLNYNVDNRAYYDAWLKEGDHVQFKNIGSNRKLTQATSRFVQKLNEFDFSSLSIGYDFYRHAFVKKLGLERLQLMFNTNDFWQLSSVEIERGTDYPFARYCSFTLNVNF